MQSISPARFVTPVLTARKREILNRLLEQFAASVNFSIRYPKSPPGPNGFFPFGSLEDTKQLLKIVNVRNPSFSTGVLNSGSSRPGFS
ncbi:MAG: hypothetical protein DRI32_05730 [Chloroflexi bacterium]|nr:MAG: hypothetical protein DRI32_05730 [Chloroflexota bacterium]